MGGRGARRLRVLATDDFERANNADLGASWTVVGGGAATMQILSNHVEPSDVLVECAEVYTPVVYEKHVYAQAKVTVVGTAGAGAGAGVCVCGLTSAATLYAVTIDHAASNNLRIRRFLAAADTALLNVTTGTWSDGALLRLERYVISSARDYLRAFLNGVEVGAVYDTTPLTAPGSAGLIYIQTETSAQLDAFEAGDLTPIPYGSGWPATRRMALVR